MTDDCERSNSACCNELVCLHTVVVVIAGSAVGVSLVHHSGSHRDASGMPAQHPLLPIIHALQQKIEEVSYCHSAANDSCF